MSGPGGREWGGGRVGDKAGLPAPLFLLPLSFPSSPSPLATPPLESGGLGRGEGEPGQGRGVAREKEGIPDQRTGGWGTQGTDWMGVLSEAGPRSGTKNWLLLVSMSAEQRQGCALRLVLQALGETRCGCELVWQRAQTSGSEELEFEFWP